MKKEKKQKRIQQVLSFKHSHHVFSIFMLSVVTVLAGCSLFGTRAPNNTEQKRSQVDNTMSTPELRTTQDSPLFRIDQNQFCTNTSNALSRQQHCFPCYTAEQGGCQAAINALLESAVSSYLVNTPQPATATMTTQSSSLENKPNTYPNFSR